MGLERIAPGLARLRGYRRGLAAVGCRRGCVGRRRGDSDGDCLRTARRFSGGRWALCRDASARRVCCVRHVAAIDRQSRRRDVRDGCRARNAIGCRRSGALHGTGRHARDPDRFHLHGRGVTSAGIPRRLPRQAGARRIHEWHRHQHRPRTDSARCLASPSTQAAFFRDCWNSSGSCRRHIGQRSPSASPRSSSCAASIGGPRACRRR